MQFQSAPRFRFSDRSSPFLRSRTPLLATLLITGFTFVIALPKAHATSLLSGTGILQYSMPSGLQQVYAPGCAPTLGTDFIDVVSTWSIRRLEPKDCALLKVATPVFSWTLPSDINHSYPMKLIVTQSDGTPVTTQNTDVPRTFLYISLPAGNYKWYVQYTSTKQTTPITSQVRRFTIASGALPSLPNGSVFADLVTNKSHPRALPAGSSFATIDQLAENSQYKNSYNQFFLDVTTYTSQTPPPPPENWTQSHFATTTDYNNWLASLRTEANAELKIMEALAYANRLRPNSAYYAAGVARLLNLSQWPTDGATSEDVQDQANRAIFLAMSIGLEAFQAGLTTTQRQNAYIALKARLAQAMNKFPSLDGVPYNSHLLTAVLFTTESLMYMTGQPDFPEAKMLLAKSWNTMVTTSGTWAGQLDGGFGNSTSYGWNAMTYISRAMAAVKLIAGIDLTNWPAFGGIGYNQIAQTPANGYQMGPFGDGVETNRNYFDYSWQEFRLLANVTRNPDYEWYWRADPRNTSLSVSLLPFHYLLLGASSTLPVAPATVPNLPNSYVYEDAGFVAMHSKTTDTNRSSVFFRSSRLGSYNHSHADNNAFTLVSKGKEIFISGGYYNSYDSDHHNYVNRATRFKNALTFNGGIGQAEPSNAPTAPGAPVYTADTRGQLLNFIDNGTWAAVTGDATLAYRGKSSTSNTWTPFVSNAIRSVAYDRAAGVVLVYDWATSDTARTWELNFQTLISPSMNGSTVNIPNGTSTVCMNIYAPAGNYSTTSGFPYSPGAGYADQYHIRYKVLNASKQLTSLTVIRESCLTAPPKVTFVNSTLVQVSVNGGAAVQFNGRTLQTP